MARTGAQVLLLALKKGIDIEELPPEVRLAAKKLVSSHEDHKHNLAFFNSDKAWERMMLRRQESGIDKGPDSMRPSSHLRVHKRRGRPRKTPLPDTEQVSEPEVEPVAVGTASQ